MNFRDKKLVKTIYRHLLAVVVAFASLLPSISLFPLNAAPGERSLNLYFVQTDERQQITFRKNGRYVQSGLKEMNNFLRDWRRNEPTDMDPALFDLLWKVYQDVGATGPITIVSAYRSPQTNEMLRSRSRGVARNSQHTKGSAIDFYIKGVPIAKLREAAMRLQVGGVGYYPNSRNPFVHLDTAGVRAWPRMTRAQLQRLFPDGRTLHIPTNGVPISAEGRRYASAEWDRCKSVPCVGSNSIISPNSDRSNGARDSAGSGRTLLDLFFGTGKEADETAPTIVAANTSVHPNAPTRLAVTTVPVPGTAPSPAPRADFLNYRSPDLIPVPAMMPRDLLIAARSNTNIPDDANLQIGAIAVAALPPANIPPSPNPIAPPPAQNSSLLAAYAPVSEPEPDAQRALQMLIERRASETSAQSASTISPVLRGSISTASLAPINLGRTIIAPNSNSDQPARINNEFDNFFDNTFNAVANARPAANQQNNIALSILNSTSRAAPNRSALLMDNSIPMRNIQFYAPDLEHVGDTLVMQTQIANSDFAIMFEPDEADFNPATELGPQTVQVNFSLSENPVLASNRFLAVAPVIISSI
ncbi:MAG: DUF882 domain-containing protein [Devosiaceae bacterium]|nr:DUF882 domain-containing protein [Devosiaceae bacterium]